LSDQLGDVFAALADPTRRGMVQVLLRDGSTSVPALSSGLPISRQAVAKHLATLEEAGLLERLPSGGREVRYGLRGDALTPAAAWLRDAEASWDRRLDKLKSAVETESRLR
jgi:DNA-binding transcriptional ArsR family regulator